MSQYVLVDRPVILSKHKINVITHGRPLSPIGSFRSISPYGPRQIVKGPYLGEKHGDTLSAPSVSLMQYQKTAQENLISINNNLSNLVQETFSGIDAICQKVRVCLLEATPVRPAQVPSEHTVTASITTKSRTDSCSQLSTCEEELISNHEQDHNEPEPENNIAEVVVENEVVNEVGNEEDDISTEEIEDRQDPAQNENTEETKKAPTLTPFVTILNPKMKSAESVGVKLIKSITSMGLSQECSGADKFQKSMKRVEKLSNYEHFLTTMVDDVKKEIDNCYSQCQQVRRDGSQTNKDVRPKTSPMDHRSNNYAIFNRDPVKNLNELKQFQKDYNEEYFFENDLITRHSSGKVSKSKGLVSCKMDYTYADVYRKRAITDLNRRMVAQVEANDSFIFFQKLMAKTRKYVERNKSATSDDVAIENHVLNSPMRYFPAEKQHGEKRQRCSLADLSKKYQDSLWFSQKKHEAKRAKREQRGHQKKRDKKSTKKEKCLPQSYTVQSGISLPSKLSPRRPASKPSEESCGHSCALPCKCKVSVTNNLPLSESDKCKIHWMRAKCSQLSNKKLKYVDILDDITKNDLIPLNAEYPRRDEIVKISDVKDSYLYKLMYGKGKANKKAWSKLFRPALKCSKDNCQKCSLMNIADGEEEQQDDRGDAEVTPDCDNNAQNDPNHLKDPDVQPKANLEKSEVVRTLSKYIFPESPEPPSDFRKNVFTVMPVHVFYDNPRIAGTNRRPDMPQKLPLLPMKETKENVRKAEWTLENVKKPKPMKVVYDPIIRKIEKEIRMVSARHENKNPTPKLVATNSWSPKNFNQYCAAPIRQTAGPPRTVKIDTLEKVPQKQQKSFSSPATDLHKRSRSTPEPVPRITVPPLWNSPDLLPIIPYQKDLTDRIQKEVDAQSCRQKNDHERKLWENKYGKSVGQKLLNFIEKQPTAYQIPVPKYALPKPVKNTARQEQMLEQLRTLKHKNDSIQNNIQRAIEVIENKMVDLLCKPATTESIEAFDEMEKEITNVLIMMKTPTPTQASRKKPKPSKPVDDCSSDVDKISDELFRKLDKILESPGMTTSGKSSKNSLVLDGKSKRKNKPKMCRLTPPKSSDMNQVCFSSTSASGEEKFTITAISPKRASKRPMHPPFVKTNKPGEAAEELVSINSEIRKLRNELHRHGSAEPLKPPETTQPLEAIQESSASKENAAAYEILPQKKVSAVVLKKKKIVPVQEQVVNLALFNNSRERSSGDQIRELPYEQKSPSETDQEDELTYSIGDGDSLAPSSNNIIVKDNADELIEISEELKAEQGALSSKRTPRSKEPELNSDTTVEQIADDTPDVVPLKEEPPNIAEISEPYFTPQTSPMTGTRDQDFKQGSFPTIVEHEESFYNLANAETSDVKKGNSLKNRKSSKYVLLPEETEAVHSKDVSEKDGANRSHEKKFINEKDGESSSGEILPNEISQKDEGGSSDSNTERDCFYQNINKIISRVESVYNQLEEFEIEMRSEELPVDPPPTVAVLQAPPKQSIVETDAFLTPFMHAVKEIRQTVSEGADSPRISSPRMYRSPSFFNVLTFLDTLTDFKEERAIEVHTSRIINSAHAWDEPIIFHQSTILNEITCSSSELVEIPKKKSSCLKNPSSHLNMSTSASKSKQKVSFLLQKEEKAIQVTVCPFHMAINILNEHKVNSESSTYSSRKDEQVSAYLDAVESKSVDKMSFNDDENTYQSNFESSDEISMCKSQMPEQLVQNIPETVQKDENYNENRKNVVEIFRNSSSEERGRDKVKVFYDSYQQGQESTQDANIIGGYYNEDSLLLVEQSLSKDISVKKRDSLEKILKHRDSEAVIVAQLLQESSLLEPLKNLNDFVDSKLLTKAIEQRQRIRMIRRRSASRITTDTKEDGGKAQNQIGQMGEQPNENFLKSVYVFVYLLMFTALNLDYKCVH